MCAWVNEIYLPFSDSVLAGGQLCKGLSSFYGRSFHRLGPHLMAFPPGFMARAVYDLGESLEAASYDEYRWALKNVVAKGVPTITWRVSVKGTPGSRTSISAWDGNHELVRTKFHRDGGPAELRVSPELDARCQQGTEHASFYKALRTHFANFRKPVPPGLYAWE